MKSSLSFSCFAKHPVLCGVTCDGTACLEQETAGSGQHTYCLAQEVLSRLGGKRGGARYRRIQQELLAYAAEQHGPIAFQMQA